jgi:hypothetical protein
MTHRSPQGGYTLLFSVLTATLVLGVAVFIVGVTEKQYELSVQARNSIYSFFAADSGIECAVNAANWTNSGGFASTTGGTLVCAGGTATFSAVTPVVITPSSILTGDTNNPVRQQQGTVSLSFNNGTVTSRGCATITLTTGRDPASNQPTTVIDARGYNTCTSTTPPAPEGTNSGTVERALRLIQSGVW